MILDTALLSVSLPARYNPTTTPHRYTSRCLKHNQNSRRCAHYNTHVILHSTNISQYLEKRILVSLNGSRKVQGTLRGYDVYLNVVLDEAVEETRDGGKHRLGMVVIRGNSVVLIEVGLSRCIKNGPCLLTWVQALDRINTDDHRGGGGRH